MEHSAEENLGKRIQTPRPQFCRQSQKAVAA